jgi:hypothetical protein
MQYYMKTQTKPGDYVDFELYNLDTTEFVCANHLDDKFIQKKIRKEGKTSKCTYCNKTRIVVPISILLETIITGIDYLFEDPGDSRYLNKESRHGYDGDTFNFIDILYDDKLDLNITDDNLYEDIYKYLNNDSIYCDKTEFYSESDDLDNLWTHFKETVKYKARFVYYFKDVFKDFQYVDPYYILDRIQRSIQKFNLVTELSKNTKLYRTRQHSNIGDVNEASDIASAPKNLAKAYGRMNPSGISMFYCSKDKDLTIAEVVDRQSIENFFYTTAIFRNKNKIRLVDLCNIPNIGSIFDDSENKERETLFFLKEFVNDISKPITSEDSIIDYIPTQIVTEYIKFNSKLNVDGIIYPSSKINGGNNIVLFYNHEESINNLDFKKSSLKTTRI